MRFAICDWKSASDSAACGSALLALLLVPALARAQQTWTLTTADFKTQSVNVVSIDDAGAKITRVHGGDASVVPWRQILQLERVAAANATTPAPPPTTRPGGSKFTLYLSNGDRIAGDAAGLEGETLAWSSPAAGRVDVKLKQVLSIARAGETPPRLDAQRTTDVVFLINGDTARGLLSAVDNTGLTVQADGNAVPVPWEAVKSVALATVATAAGDGSNANERGVRVTLADGSVLSSPAFTLAADKATLGAADAKRELPASAVVAVEQVNGPVAWLSSLQLSESVQTPFLETVFPARMDRTVRGEPIRFGDRTFPRGIGVHAYSRLVWQLPEGNRYKTFRTQYAIDGDKPYANVTVRVKLDDKVVHEQQDVVAGKLSEVVQAPLAGGAKTLTLEVDYGKTYDVQDRFNWIEPALLAE